VRIKHQLSFLVMLGSGLAFAGDVSAASVCKEGAAPETKELVVMADWVPWANQIPIFMAQKTGLYEKAGLTVDLKSPPNPADPIKLVAMKRVHISFTYPPEIMSAQENTIPVVSIAALIHQASEGYIFLTESGVKTLQDLRGKKIVGNNNPTGKAIIQTVLKSAGMTLKDVEYMDTGVAGQQFLLAKKVDAFHGTSWGTMKVVDRKLKEEGRAPAGIFKFADHGVPPFPFLVLAANQSWAKENPQTVCAFLKATVQGLQTAWNDPEPANQWLQAARPGVMTLEDHRDRWEAMRPLWADKTGRIFVQDAAVWKTTQDWALEYGIVRQPVGPATDYFTNDYIAESVAAVRLAR